jgi:hypothetical protein
MVPGSQQYPFQGLILWTVEELMGEPRFSAREQSSATKHPRSRPIAEFHRELSGVQNFISLKQNILLLP